MVHASGLKLLIADSMLKRIDKYIKASRHVNTVLNSCVFCGHEAKAFVMGPSEHQNFDWTTAPQYRALKLENILPRVPEKKAVYTVLNLVTEGGLGE